MVWLFGGGYYYGSPSLLLYDGKALALTGNVVVVNINYRVGPFGYLYLDHEDAPGNMGMLDQVSYIPYPLRIIPKQGKPQQYRTCSSSSETGNFAHEKWNKACV
ncbi:unnamed protein product [Anisakis simplex]|uniref:COesterase domain-containing protein n=1 Tax=Anisakis simplex TaxID=6269 RepID=A0A0M3JL18_ANISI|nr:unnamed protein product [Anisakis simplex]